MDAATSLPPLVALLLWSALSGAEAPPRDDGLGLEEVIVTANPDRSRNMVRSLAISTLDRDSLRTSAAASSAEILRRIPGLRVEASGGEGNANLTARGLPVSAGGARYVQFQEDGLPVLQFGDIAFATADQFVRTDASVERLEVIRGGMASTLASNAPGGIVNLISNTGASAGGTAAISRGVDVDRTRYAASSGGPLADDRTRYFIGGFYRRGTSPRDAGVDMEDGGQIKANLTHTSERGFARLHLKYLHDQVPMHMPVPVSSAGGSPTALPGIDPRTASFYSPHWGRDLLIDAGNSPHTLAVNDGLQVHSTAAGIELGAELGGGFSLEDRLRVSRNSGRFISVFPADNGRTDGPFTLASGPGAGQPYSGEAFTATVFNVALNDLGNTLNDLQLKKAFSVGADSSLDTALGLYYSAQQVDLTWHFNQYLLGADGSAPPLLNSPATVTGAPGLLAQGTDVWGGCCLRDIDATYTTIAPYAYLGWEHGRWNIDASLREDRQRVSGHMLLASDQQFRGEDRQPVAYRIAEQAYSAGANYRLSPDLALFLRHSQGHSFNADRIMFNGFALDGSVAIPVNEVRQTEGGIKWRRQDFSAFITGFHAATRETNYEATTDTFTRRDYAAHGVELELAWQWHNLHLQAGATWTRARIESAEDAELQGHTPRRQADWVYQLLPSWHAGPVTAGVAFIGTSRAWGDDANRITLPGYMTVDAFIRYRLTPRTQLSLTANNLTDKLAYTEAESAGHAARALNGRTVMAGIDYEW
jgi:outer membrane receptor protein involved in Fe transport